MKPFKPTLLACLCLAVASSAAFAQSPQDEQQRLARLRAFQSQLTAARAQHHTEALAQLDADLTHFVREGWSESTPAAGARPSGNAPAKVALSSSNTALHSEEEELHPRRGAHGVASPDAAPEDARLTAAQLVALSGHLDPAALQLREQLLAKLIRASRMELTEVARAEQEPAMPLRHDRCESGLR